jgi:hypothetical protein
VVSSKLSNSTVKQMHWLEWIDPIQQRLLLLLMLDAEFLLEAITQKNLTESATELLWLE